MKGFKKKRDGMDFNGREAAAMKVVEGSRFLDVIREQHGELYEKYAERDDGFYNSLQELLEDLESDAWHLIEQALKESYKNGLTRNLIQRRRKA